MTNEISLTDLRKVVTTLRENTVPIKDGNYVWDPETGWVTDPETL